MAEGYYELLPIAVIFINLCLCRNSNLEDDVQNMTVRMDNGPFLV